MQYSCPNDIIFQKVRKKVSGREGFLDFVTKFDLVFRTSLSWMSQNKPHYMNNKM